MQPTISPAAQTIADMRNAPKDPVAAMLEAKIPEPAWENGSTLILDTEPAYSGHLLDFPTPVPTTMQVFVNGFWYIYKLDGREKEEAEEVSNSQTA